MASRQVNRLTALQVSRAKERGLYSDGGGLNLQVAAGGSKSWVFRYKLNGRTRYLGLGPLHTVPLALAREKAAEARRALLDGLDPIDARRAQRAADALASASALTFKQAADAYVEAHRAGWKNAKHAAQWSATLETYAYPTMGKLAVGAVDVSHVMKVLEQEIGDEGRLWTARPETASRVRGRIEAVLDWAKARHFRSGENPARWRGHLDHLLPARSKIARTRHHAALPWQDAPKFMVDLRQRDAIAARALEFLILTASRTSETIGALWAEIDLQAKVWTVPAARMKAAADHRVPLSDAAVSVLEKMQAVKSGDYVFPGQRPKRPLSNMSMLMLLKDRMGLAITAHGFRSTFRDWAAEATAFPGEIAEAALAHSVSDKVIAAYRRTDFFDRRRKLMEQWAGFLSRPHERGIVLPLARVEAG